MKNLQKSNKHSALIFSLVGLLMMTSIACTNLDEEVYGRIPADSFGSTQAEMNALIGPIYRTLPAWWSSYHVFLSEIAGEMAIVPTRRGGDYWNNGMYKELRQHSWTPDNGRIAPSYNAMMTGITTCNRIYKTVEQSNIPDKEMVLAEIRGVRAFWYYTLVDHYGNVPLVTDFAETDLPVTTKRDVIYKFIVDELNAIKDLLNPTVSSATYGTFTKGAAYALLAKMYLNAEVWNPAGGAKWQECMNACDVVMSLNYKLETDWRKNFTVDNHNSTEIIFPIVFSKETGGFTVHRFTLHYNSAVFLSLNTTCNNGLSANPDFVNMFDPDDRRFGWSFLLGPNTDPVTGEVLLTAHGNPLIFTIDIPLIESSIDADGWGQVEQETGARCWKWEIVKGAIANLDNDFALFRLADIYLMKAECLVRLGRDNDVATNLVNTIRSRVFDSAEKLKSSVTLDDIYTERRFEMAWEGYSRQDMIRFGTFLKPSFLKPHVSNAKYLLFPIPQTALNANPKLTQNPGY